VVKKVFTLKAREQSVPRSEVPHPASGAIW
jgi:hypothetical protein